MLTCMRTAPGSAAPTNLTEKRIAYFSFEYGLHESLMVYAGGLGVLSGDHLKEASDLGLPLVAVGFLLTFGYFSQGSARTAGRKPATSSISTTCLIALYDEDRKPITISIELPRSETSLALRAEHRAQQADPDAHQHPRK